MKILLLILLVGCGRTIKTGSVEKTQEQPVAVSQFTQCSAPRNPEIVYMGIPCRLQGMNGQNYLYVCSNNRNILVDCQGRVL